MAPEVRLETLGKALDPLQAEDGHAAGALGQQMERLPGAGLRLDCGAADVARIRPARVPPGGSGDVDGHPVGAGASGEIPEGAAEVPARTLQVHGTRAAGRAGGAVFLQPG